MRTGSPFERYSQTNRFSDMDRAEVRARLEQERRRRAREKHNRRWSDVRRDAPEGLHERFVEILRRGWEDVKDDPIREIVAAWLAESLRRLMWTDFRSGLPEVARWKYNDGYGRIERGLMRGFDRHVAEEGSRFAIYDWGNEESVLRHGPAPTDVEALAAEGDVRARAAIDWVHYQLQPEI